MNVVLFGAPGSGKGTQSSLMVSELKMHQISTGDLFRAAIKNKTELGQQAQGYLDRGELVPDSVVIGMVEDVLKSGVKNFILDGFPRTLAQAKALNELLEKLGLSLDYSIFLEVPMSELESRLCGRRTCKSCGAVYHVQSKPSRKEGVCDACGGETYQRNDDKVEVIGARLKNYEEFTSPLKAFYQELGKFRSVNGALAEREVFVQIKDLIG